MKRKEKKSLLYLITIATVIALMVFACKNKPTQTNDFITVDETLTNTANTNALPENPITNDQQITNSQQSGITNEDGFLKGIAGTYQSENQYNEGYGSSARQYHYKAYIEKYGTNENNYCLKLYKGAEHQRTMYRDTTKDSGNKKALYDWQTHFIEDKGGGTLHLVLDAWDPSRPIVLKKQK